MAESGQVPFFSRCVLVSFPNAYARIGTGRQVRNDTLLIFHRAIPAAGRLETIGVVKGIYDYPDSHKNKRW